MAENKTQATEQSVEQFLHSVENKQMRDDCFQLVELMEDVTGEKATMWGTSIVGFGSYHYKYASGREGDFLLTGFAPRKSALTLYIMAGFERYDELMAQLGKYKTGKSCLYVKKLADIDTDVLRELVKQSAEHVAATNAE
jgi:hypothetical protein